MQWYIESILSGIIAGYKGKLQRIDYLNNKNGK